MTFASIIFWLLACLMSALLGLLRPYDKDFESKAVFYGCGSVLFILLGMGFQIWAAVT